MFLYIVWFGFWPAAFLEWLVLLYVMCCQPSNAEYTLFTLPYYIIYITGSKTEMYYSIYYYGGTFNVFWYHKWQPYLLPEKLLAGIGPKRLIRNNHDSPFKAKSCHVCGGHLIGIFCTHCEGPKNKHQMPVLKPWVWATWQSICAAWSPSLLQTSIVGIKVKLKSWCGYMTWLSLDHQNVASLLPQFIQVKECKLRVSRVLNGHQSIKQQHAQQTTLAI